MQFICYGITVKHLHQCYQCQGFWTGKAARVLWPAGWGGPAGCMSEDRTKKVAIHLALINCLGEDSQKSNKMYHLWPKPTSIGHVFVNLQHFTYRFIAPVF